jgi:hypothetical protein
MLAVEHKPNRIELSAPSPAPERHIGQQGILAELGITTLQGKCPSAAGCRRAARGRWHTSRVVELCMALRHIWIEGCYCCVPAWIGARELLVWQQLE